MRKIFFLLTFCLIFSLNFNCSAEELPKAELPVLLLSAGQSPGIFVANTLADRAGLAYDSSDVVTLETIKKGVGLEGMVEGEGVHVWRKSEVPDGTPYKTIVMVVGASLKGMGASGLSLDDEISRLEEIVNYCKDEGILIIAMHIEGEARRGRPGSDNERIIDAVAPFADYLIVTETGNQDGRFNEIAEENEIPLSIVQRPVEIPEIFKEVFSIEE